MNLGWISIISVLLIILCFSYTLTFIENIHQGDKRIAKQSKLVAIMCLGLGLLIPIVFILIAYDF
ncbi:hypothetical protein NC661_13490 [Aquibacillus koreensis]|uniref:Uncharacterized protein n=1 Tax=Aquibacillus koreensis TaxID=279446 RepID=A0A9X3WQ95_9BACI|nr:hypothetical protein [Aquibacillus koreensis]MCT2536264.1 hypothetical protein [Aquibacillus koreensis]MDC3421384.1 hypothetical protein [Aquibacillus koreensis]